MALNRATTIICSVTSRVEDIYGFAAPFKIPVQTNRVYQWFFQQGEVLA